MGYMDCCDWSQCTECGACLMKCPVLQMGKEEAQEAVKELLEGGLPARIAKECTLCMSCNGYCPEGLRPYELILQRVSEQESRQESVSGLVSYFLLGSPGPNFYPDLYSTLSRGEHDILEKWAQFPDPSDELLWIGCIGRMFCKDLDNSKVLASLPKFSPSDLCCGELHYRSGQWDAFMDNTEKVFSVLSKIETKRMVCYCGSCCTFLSRILPKVAGKSLPYEVISMYQWLREKQERGEIQVEKPLNYEAAIHESCYATELGEDFSDTLRAVYSAAGCQVLEMPHNRDQPLSCGAASIVRDFDLKSVVKTQARRFKEVKSTGVNQMALNCPGCYLTLAPHSWGRRVKLRYMPEELLRAYGDDITTPISKLMRTVMFALAKRAPLAWKKVDPKDIRVAS